MIARWLDTGRSPKTHCEMKNQRPKDYFGADCADYAD